MDPLGGLLNTHVNIACPYSITSPGFTVLKVLLRIPTGNSSPYSQVSSLPVCFHSTKGMILGGWTQWLSTCTLSLVGSSF